MKILLACVILALTVSHANASQQADEVSLAVFDH
jgi:hypothetical protein